MAVNRARVRWTWIAAGVAVATAALLLVGGERLRSTFDSLTRATPDETRGPLLEGSTPEPGSNVGPLLQGARRQAPGEREPAHGPVTVTVLDRAGIPVAGVCVRSDAHPERVPPATQWQVTDASGRGHFEDLPYYGSASVMVVLQAAGRNDVLGPSHHADAGVFFGSFGESSNTGVLVDLDGVTNGLPDNSQAGFDNGGGGPGTGAVLPPSSGVFFRAIEDDIRLASALVTGPEVTLTLDRGLPLEVDVRAADGGRALSTRWQVTPRLEWAPDAYESPRIPVTAGAEASISVKLEPPRGMVAPFVEPWSVWVHPGAARLKAVVPVRSEVEVLAEFPPEVLPFREDQWDIEASIGGRPLPSLSLHARRAGLVEVRGVEHLVGDTVVLGGTLADAWTVRGSAVLGPDPRAPVLVRMTCEPRPADQPRIIALGSEDGVSPGLTFRFATGPGLSVVIKRFGSPFPLDLDGSGGAVRLLVRLPNGRPAVGAVVRGGWGEVRADAEGCALLTGVEPGAVATIGGAGAAKRVTLQPLAHKTSELEVHTTNGGQIDVIVVDDLERPLPYATLSVKQPSEFPWIDLDGDVQRIDPYTDERGRRTLRTVEQGLVKVSAAYGSRSVEAEVEVLEGETTRVRLVLPAADAPAKAPEPPPAPPAADAPAR